MKKHSRTRGVLAAALILATLPATGAASSSATGTDASAIASFFSIGFANATNKFASIRGDSVALGEYKATRWPDHAHFRTCGTWHFPADAEINQSEQYLYSCNSTFRVTARESLFKMAERAVRANLPADYSSSGEQPRSDGAPYEHWTRAGSPDVKLWAFEKHGKTYYELSMEVNA